MGHFAWHSGLAPPFFRTQWCRPGVGCVPAHTELRNLVHEEEEGDTMERSNVSRRTLLKGGGAALAGLSLQVSRPGARIFTRRQSRETDRVGR